MDGGLYKNRENRVLTWVSECKMLIIDYYISNNLVVVFIMKKWWKIII